MNKEKMRNKIDFYKYLFFLDKSQGIKVLMNLLIFGISLMNIVPSIIHFKGIDSTNIFMGLVFLLSLFNIIWEAREEYKEIQSFAGDNKQIVMNKKKKITKYENMFNFDMICCSLEEKEWNFQNVALSTSKEDRVMFSEELNEYLWDNDLKLDTNTKKGERVKEFILKNKDIVTPFFQYKYHNSMKNDQDFFNEDKLCMASDIIKRRQCVQCYKSNYYNSFLTNEICMQTLERKEDSVIIYDASNFFPCSYNKNSECRLESITRSRMNNHIGISTIAFTNDNYIVIRRQSFRAQQNREQYVPTGSGSCNWNDRRDDSFIHTILYAMQRELWEENGANIIADSPENVGETKILGFFRWLRRGGKPEFVGITRVNCDSNSMKVNSEELMMNYSGSNSDEFYLSDIDKLPYTIEQIKDYANISIPLEVCLKALEFYYKKCPDKLKKFLGL